MREVDVPFGSNQMAAKRGLGSERRSGFPEVVVTYIDGGIEGSGSGWHYSTEDMPYLISGLKKVPTPRGGFLGIGSFHNLDIALEKKAEAIVLLDKDSGIGELNKQVLELAMSVSEFEQALPMMRRFVIDNDVMPIEFFDLYHDQGTHLRSRILLSWAKRRDHFDWLRFLISHKKVAVAHGDLLLPETVAGVGDFFEKCGLRLILANISNVENPGYKFDERERDAIEKIPKSLLQMAGCGETRVISSIATEAQIPDSHQKTVTVLQSEVKRAPETGCVISFEFDYILRKLEQMVKDGALCCQE